jgi:hypothetical protein
MFMDVRDVDFLPAGKNALAGASMTEKKKVTMTQISGPPRAKVLRRLHGVDSPNPKLQLTQPILQPSTVGADPGTPPPVSKGIAIISRFPNSKNSAEQQGTNLVSVLPNFFSLFRHI